MKTSKIVSVESVTPWTNNENRTFYFHELFMENGEKITLMKAKENAFNAGDEVNYDEYEKDWKKRYKEITENKWWGWNGKKTSSTASFALSYAKDLVVADKVGIENILATADKFKKWLDDNA